MRKLILEGLMLSAIMAAPLIARAGYSSEDYLTGGINTLTAAAGAWTQVCTNNVGQDMSGNYKWLRAYQIAVYTSVSSFAPLDFYYAYSSAPTQVFPWHATSWGPLQTKQIPPSVGVYISLTYTSGTAAVYVDQKY